MIKISERLWEISNYVRDNCKIVDIGCDHGYLDIFLYENRENIHVLAVDINENALGEARKNIKALGLDDKIETRISDGLKSVSATEIDTIVISGLGAHTIVGILYNDTSKLENVRQIIVQCNTDIPFLRTKIVGLEYHIANEALVEDRGIIYTVIDFHKGKRKYRKKELYFGPILLKTNGPLFQKKNEEDLAKLKHLLEVIPKKNVHHRLVTYNKIRMYKSIKKETIK